MTHWRKLQVANRKADRMIVLAAIADPQLRRRSSKVRRRDKVYSENHGNGAIRVVDWENRRVVVKYLDPKQDVEYSVGDFTGRWTDKLGGLYYLTD